MEKKPIDKKKYLIGGIIAFAAGVLLIVIANAGSGNELLHAPGMACVAGGTAAIFLALKKDKPGRQGR